MSDEPQVTENTAEHRFEIRSGGELAGFTVYRDRPGDVRVFIHTEIDDAFGGHGLGGILVRHALNDAREHGLSVVPRCPFVRAFIDKHEEYADLVVADAE